VPARARAPRRAKDGDEHRKIIEGPRAKNEISDEAWTGYMQALGLRTAG
jgi:hypothetical protein